MRRALTGSGTAVVLGGPFALAFFAGGYFTEPRLWALLATWVAVLALVLTGQDLLPRGRAGWVALVGLGLMCAWTGASIAWAPLADPATQSLERLLLYLGAFLLALGVLRSPRAARALEPAYGLGAAVVVLYGLAGRLLPREVAAQPSLGAGDRLDQPLTYWNAEGALAAMGLVLCARVAGDPSRRTGLRALAAAACVPLGLAVYLSYSRGALAAGLVGLLVLVAAAPRRSQVRALLVALLAAGLACVPAAAFSTVSRLTGTLVAREHDGRLVALVALGLALIAAWATARLARQAGNAGALLPHAGALPKMAALAVALAALGLVAGGLQERHGRSKIARNGGATRLVSVSSRRYDYWRVGLAAWRDEAPLRGLGAGGFATAWLERRPVLEGAQQVHSLPLEMLVELGLPGVLALALLGGGVWAGARRRLLADSAAAAGPVAALVVWGLHATIDWDWQMPAVSLPALVLAAALLSGAGPIPRPRTRAGSVAATPLPPPPRPGDPAPRRHAEATPKR